MHVLGYWRAHPLLCQGMPDQPPKVLTEEQYKALSLEERMAYLQGLMNEIRQKLEQTRAQHEKTRRLTNADGSE